MSLIEFVDPSLVLVTFDPNKLPEAINWLKSKGWDSVTDYVYVGWEASRGDMISFSDKDKAMLFKLTFGG